jgi:hypothetical protein
LIVNTGRIKEIDEIIIAIVNKLINNKEKK